LSARFLSGDGAWRQGLEISHAHHATFPIHQEKQTMNVIELAYTVYPVTDLNRARTFYEGTLGLKAATAYEGGGMGWVEYEIGPGVLALGSGAEKFKPSADGGSVAAIRELRERQCGFVIEPMETSGCHMAGIFDPDGNTIIIHKRKGSNS
jgi:catechol 2,3-dioxygenase-like lactoylglutathione lyase family enzyme